MSQSGSLRTSKAPGQGYLRGHRDGTRFNSRLLLSLNQNLPSVSSAPSSRRESCFRLFLGARTIFCAVVPRRCLQVDHARSSLPCLLVAWVIVDGEACPTRLGGLETASHVESGDARHGAEASVLCTALGRRQHYWCGGQLRLWKVDSFSGDRQEAEPAMGGDFVHGTGRLPVVPFFRCFVPVSDCA